MHASLRSDDVVYETVCVLLEPVIVLHRDLDRDIVAGPLAVDDLIVKSFRRPVQILNEFNDSALIAETL